MTLTVTTFTAFSGNRWLGTCVEGSCLNNGKSTPTATTPAKPPTSSTGSGFVKVAKVVGDVKVLHLGSSAPETVTSTTVFGRGDRVVTGMESSLTVTFADGHQVTIRELTDTKLEALDRSDQSVRTRLWLKAGEISADLLHSSSATSDFSCKTPTATCSVRGTSFTIYADSISNVSILSVRSGRVDVDPNAPGLPVVKLTAGKEVLVGRTAISRVSGIGKAGTIKSVNPATARRLVLDRLRPARFPCDLKPVAAVSVRSVGSSWIVTVPVPETSLWRVAGTAVTPVNTLAKKIARNCA